MCMSCCLLGRCVAILVNILKNMVTFVVSFPGSVVSKSNRAEYLGMEENSPPKDRTWNTHLLCFAQAYRAKAERPENMQ